MTYALGDAIPRITTWNDDGTATVQFPVLSVQCVACGSMIRAGESIHIEQDKPFQYRHSPCCP